MNRVSIAIRSPASVSTSTPCAGRREPRGSRRYAPKAGCPFARVGTITYVRPSRIAMVRRKSPTAATPWYSSGSGGIVSHTSSVSSATTASTSPASKARAMPSRIRRSRAEPGSGASSRPAPGNCASSPARARLSALFTALSLVPSVPATSAARNPSTSRNTSTARCLAGRCCSAVRNASDTASLASYRASGPGARSGSPSSSTSGYGSSRLGTARSRCGSGSGTSVRHADARSVDRPARSRSAFRQRLVAIRYSHVRIDARPS